MKVETVRKISMKTMEAQPSMEDLAKMEKLTGEKNYLAVAQVFGIAKKFRPGESDNGPFVRFLGQFKGVNVRSKTEYLAGAAFFPKPIEEALFGAMDPEAPNDVQFAFEIGVKFAAEAATKYEYVCRSLIKPAENDALALLQRSALAALEDKSKK